MYYAAASSVKMEACTLYTMSRTVVNRSLGMRAISRDSLLIVLLITKSVHMVQRLDCFIYIYIYIERERERESEIYCGHQIFEFLGINYFRPL
jgi:hypothetical protein